MASPPIELFLVERQEPMLVKPFAPSPRGVLSLSTVDNDPNLDLICQTVYVYRAEDEHPAGDNGPEQLQGGDSWRLDPASLIREGLSKALVYYYPLGGRLRREEGGKIQVECTGEGVPFSSVMAGCTLASINDLEGVDVQAAKQLVFQAENAAAHPLMMQVTKFACGGFTLGMGLSHAVCDGFGSMQFLRAVAELAGGASEPSVKPVWERERLVAAPALEWQLPAAGEDVPATTPHLPSSDLVHGRIDMDGVSIRTLKKALQEESSECNSPGEGFTAFEALGALLWRSRFRALEMNPEGTTHFVLAVGIRNIMDPPLPEGYYGNAFVGSHVFMRGRELCEEPLWRVAAAIRESKRKAQEAGYVMPYLGMLDTMWQEKKKPGGSVASLLVTDWRHMGLAGAAFGGKQAVNCVPLPWDMFGHVGLCILMPLFSLKGSMDGGVRVLVCLPRAVMARFEEEMASFQDLPCGKV